MQLTSNPSSLESDEEVAARVANKLLGIRPLTIEEVLDQKMAAAYDSISKILTDQIFNQSPLLSRTPSATVPGGTSIRETFTYGQLKDDDEEVA